MSTPFVSDDEPIEPPKPVFAFDETDEEFENYAKKAWDTEMDLRERITALEEQVKRHDELIAKLAISALKATMLAAKHDDRLNLLREVFKNNEAILNRLQGDGK